MCIGIPLQTIEDGDFMVMCHGRNGEQSINMMLIGAQPVGTWVLNFLGLAREVLTEEDAININKALDGLGAIMQGEENIDVDHYFPDMEDT